jgi:hypothetical protein
MVKPPITITCECGEQRAVAYGERWVCQRCRRSWNTEQIPVDEYERLLHRVRRRKLEALGLGAIFAAVLILLIAFVGSKFIIVIPLVMTAWLFVYLPIWRRRVRAAARDAPQWELHPE